MEKLFLGVDGGQTSTTAMIADGAGRVLGTGCGGPCNHVGAAEGRQRFVSAMGTCLDMACRSAGLDADRVQFESAALGFSGGPGDKEAILAELLRTTRLTVTSDIDIALAGALAGEPGIVTIAGTGSVAFGKNSEGRRARAGGWGSLFGDEGAAFDLTRQALRAALRSEEDWGPPTILKERLLEATGIAHIHDLVRKFYTVDFPVPRIAGYARLVDEAAQAGDAVASEIIQNAAAHLARLTAVIRRRLFPPEDQIRGAYVGGTFRSRLLLTHYRTLVENAGNCTLIAPLYDPAVGALLEAFRAAGLHPVLTGVPGSEK